MAIEVEFFGLTGIVGPGANDLIVLKHPPSTGPNGGYDIALDPVDGPAQILGTDFGVTHLDPAYGNTGALALDLAGSDIKDVRNNFSHGVTGILNLRALYNYTT